MVWEMKSIIQHFRDCFSHELCGIMILGLLLRFVLMPYLMWPYDMGAYQSGLAYLISGNDPYTFHVSIYPPLVHFITFPLFRLAYQLGASFDFHSISEFLTGTRPDELVAMSQVSPLFLVLWKIPLLCFDLLTGILIYYFAKEIMPDSDMPRLCFSVWFFNPFTLAITYLTGSYDVAVAFFILLGTYFVFKNNYFSAGLSFGLGTLTKISPIFIAIPLGVVLLFKEVVRSFNAQRFKTNARLLLKFALGCIAPLVFFAPLFIEYANLMYSGISKEIAITGGLNQWFFAADPSKSYLLNQYTGVIQTTFSYFPLICSVLALLFCKFFNLTHETVLLITAFFTSLIYLFLPITLQPQYLLWIMPLLVILLSKWRSFIWPLGLLSVAGFFFYLSLQGPQIFLYPLAMYTSLYSPQKLISNIAVYQNARGIMSSYLRQDLSTIFGGIGFLAQILTVLLLIKNLWKGRDGVK
jgi:hypothetical protein